MPGPCDKLRCDYNAKCIITAGGIAACECPKCKTTPDMQPICGSDGRTYASNCHLGSAICQLKKEIYAIGNGPCSKYQYFQAFGIH